MKKHKSTLAVLFSLCLGSIASAGAETLTDLEDITSFALARNLEYRQALLAVNKAASQIEGPFRLSRTALSITGQYGQDAGWGAGAALNVPVLDQLGINAKINQDKASQISISVNPLYHSDSSAQLALVYRKALLQAEQILIQTEQSVQGAALAWMESQRKIEYQKSLAQIKQIAYEDEKVRYSVGEATLDDVRESLIAWSQAENQYTESLQNHRQSEAALYTALNSDLAGIEISPLTITDLYYALEKLKSATVPGDGYGSKDYSVLYARIETESALAKYRNTWTFSPDLSFSASLAIDPNFGNRNLTASLSLSISPENWKGGDKQRAAEELLLAQEAAALAEMKAGISYSQALTALETAARAREIRELELEQAGLLREEADFLYPRGEISFIEYSEILLTRQAAENNLFSALISEYSAWQDIFSYHNN